MLGYGRDTPKPKRKRVTEPKALTAQRLVDASRSICRPSQAVIPATPTCTHTRKSLAAYLQSLEQGVRDDVSDVENCLVKHILTLAHEQCKARSVRATRPAQEALLPSFLAAPRYQRPFRSNGDPSKSSVEWRTYV